MQVHSLRITYGNLMSNITHFHSLRITYGNLITNIMHFHSLRIMYGKLIRSIMHFFTLRTIGNVANHVLLRKYFELEIWVAEADQLFSCLEKHQNFFLSFWNSSYKVRPPDTNHTIPQVQPPATYPLNHAGYFKNLLIKTLC